MISESVTCKTRIHPYLASGVDDITVIVNTLVTDTLGEGVFDSRVVRLDELVLCELDHEGRLS